STAGRSPPRQRSHRSWAGSPRNAESGMSPALQVDLHRDAVEGAGELPAPGLRGASEHGGDLGPLPPLSAEGGRAPLLPRQPPAQLGEQLASGDDSAGTRVRPGRLAPWPAGLHVATLVAPLRLLPARLVGHLVARDGHQQTNQLGRLLELVLTGRGADEKA